MVTLIVVAKGLVTLMLVLVVVVAVVVVVVVIVVTVMRVVAIVAVMLVMVVMMVMVVAVGLTYINFTLLFLSDFEFKMSLYFYRSTIITTPALIHVLVHCCDTYHSWIKLASGKLDLNLLGLARGHYIRLLCRIDEFVFYNHFPG